MGSYCLEFDSCQPPVQSIVHYGVKLDVTPKIKEISLLSMVGKLDIEGPSI